MSLKYEQFIVFFYIFRTNEKNHKLKELKSLLTGIVLEIKLLEDNATIYISLQFYESAHFEVE